MSENVLKRPHPGDEENSAQKRPRSNNGSPAPGSISNGQSNPNLEKTLEETRAKAAALREKIASMKSGGASPAPPPPAGSAAPANSAMSKIEQMRARVAAATGRVNTALPARPPPPPAFVPPPPPEENISRGRGGLDIGLHPALLNDTSQDRSRGKATSRNRHTESPVPEKGKAQLDLSGPSAEEIKNNPYYDPNLGKGTMPKQRHSRQLVFNQKGKYMQQAAALRRQAQLEAMKKRIAERARQAGIDEEMDVEKAFAVPEPPAVEWWDEGLVNGSDYSALDDPSNMKIDTPDSIITIYVQHPVLLDPPQDKKLPAPKPMFLTAKEQAKIRRQRRMADLKEQQAKIRLGLEPAPPPKVKKSNLMRVLGEEAVRDPTAVESRVNRDIAERFSNHVAANQERKLSKEERYEKLAMQQEKDASLGIHVNVYKIDSLANGRHRFKISKNAEQNALSGICIMNPKFSLVIVEGGAHSIKNYKKLMLNRIDWTENPGPNAVREGNREVLASWLETESEKGELKDLSLNSCSLIWEGEEKTRAFRKWLGGRVCESDASARDTLSRSKMESFWTLAKSYKPDPIF